MRNEIGTIGDILERTDEFIWEEIEVEPYPEHPTTDRLNSADERAETIARIFSK